MTAAARRQSAGHLWRQIERSREEHGKSTANGCFGAEWEARPRRRAEGVEREVEDHAVRFGCGRAESVVGGDGARSHTGRQPTQHMEKFERAAWWRETLQER